MTAAMQTAPTEWVFDHLSVVSKPCDPALTGLAALLGLTSGYRPPFPFPGRWLYQGNDAQLHVIERSDAEQVELNHLAFRSEQSLADLLEQIHSLGLQYRVSHVPADNTAQVFIRLSDTLLIELNVPDSQPGEPIDANTLIKE